jgi:hypothetical protein
MLIILWKLGLMPVKKYIFPTLSKRLLANREPFLVGGTIVCSYFGWLFWVKQVVLLIQVFYSVIGGNPDIKMLN